MSTMIGLITCSTYIVISSQSRKILFELNNTPSANKTFSPSSGDKRLLDLVALSSIPDTYPLPNKKNERIFPIKKVDMNDFTILQSTFPFLRQNIGTKITAYTFVNAASANINPVNLEFFL